MPVAVGISSVERINQGDTTLHMPGCSALLKRGLGEADLSENLQCCRKTGKTLGLYNI